jgi:hypothetical protein
LIYAGNHGGDEMAEAFGIAGHELVAAPEVFNLKSSFALIPMGSEA